MMGALHCYVKDAYNALRGNEADTERNQAVMGTSTFEIFARALLQLKLKALIMPCLTFISHIGKETFWIGIQLLGRNQLTEEQWLIAQKTFFLFNHRKCCCLLFPKFYPTPLRTHGLKPGRLLCPWDSPGKNTGVGCHFLFQGIFLTQGSNLSPALAGGLFTTNPPRKPISINEHLLSTRCILPTGDNRNKRYSPYCLLKHRSSILSNE